MKVVTCLLPTRQSISGVHVAPYTSERPHANLHDINYYDLCKCLLLYFCNHIYVVIVICPLGCESDMHCQTVLRFATDERRCTTESHLFPPTLSAEENMGARHPPPRACHRGQYVLSITRPPSHLLSDRRHWMWRGRATRRSLPARTESSTPRPWCGLIIHQRRHDRSG